jgi:2,4-dienoyl-CoA reductase-like NADH-dependent reductase (Old Yellow Enzyme family)
MDVNISPPYLAEVKQVDEKHEGVMRGTPHDALAIFGPLIKVPPKDLENRSETQIRGEAATATGANPSPTRLLLNVDLTPEEAEKLLEEGKIDGAVFGMSWITNPDFYKRIVEGKGFNQNVNFHGLYSWNGDNIGEGYADYPIAVSA